MTTQVTVTPPAARHGMSVHLTRALLVAAGCLGLAIALSWPVPLHPASTMVDAFGDPLLNAWILAWDADRALHAFREYWTGLFFFPYPDTVAYSEHLLGIALFTAPIQWLTGNAVLSYNAAFVGVTALAAGGAWLLARDVCGRGDAAVVAATAFACAPFRVPHVSHLQVLASGWIPALTVGTRKIPANGTAAVDRDMGDRVPAQRDVERVLLLLRLPSHGHAARPPRVDQPRAPLADASRGRRRGACGAGGDAPHSPGIRARAPRAGARPHA